MCWHHGGACDGGLLVVAPWWHVCWWCFVVGGGSWLMVVVLVVVVCLWWWRHGGVWREGCHWLHIHVPPSLVPTILLHHPGHQIILHQTILCTKPHCTNHTASNHSAPPKQDTKPPASAITNHLGHTIFQSQPQITQAIINMPPLIPTSCFLQMRQHIRG